MSGVIHGELDGIAQDAQGLQEVSDTQAQIMHGLANAMESLVPAMRGQASASMQNVGAQLHAQGMRFSTTFADHSQKMGNNRQIFESHDSDNQQLIEQVNNLITG
jgi:uncharacterized protein YukE